jgi:hypothetical protein
MECHGKLDSTVIGPAFTGLNLSEVAGVWISGRFAVSCAVHATLRGLQ